MSKNFFVYIKEPFLESRVKDNTLTLGKSTRKRQGFVKDKRVSGLLNASKCFYKIREDSEVFNVYFFVNENDGEIVKIINIG